MESLVPWGLWRICVGVRPCSIEGKARGTWGGTLCLDERLSTEGLGQEEWFGEELPRRGVSGKALWIANIIEIGFYWGQFMGI